MNVQEGQGKGQRQGQAKEEGYVYRTLTYTPHLLGFIKLVTSVLQDKGVKYVIAVMNASNCYIHMSITSCNQYFHVYWYLMNG